MKGHLVRGIVLTALVGISGCASRIPVVTTPAHPEYVFPTVPSEYSGSREARRHGEAWTFFQAGDLIAAEARYAVLLESNPGFYPAETALGWVSMARGNSQAAAGHFDRAAERQPAYVPALIGRGEAMLVLEDDGEALRSFEAALAVDPELVDVGRIVQELRFMLVSEQLEVARAAAAADRFAEAKTVYAQLIAASPDSAFLHVELGRVEQAQGNVDAALEHARRAQQRDPTDPVAFLFEGELREEADDLPAAILAYERADRLDPTAETARRIERLNEWVRLAELPPEVQEIPSKSVVTRGELAALVGVRFPNLLRDAASGRPVIITDTRDHWGSQWIQSVAQAQVMTVDAGYRFEPARVLQRGELAEAVNAMLDLIASLDPAAASGWADAPPSFSDMRPGHLNYSAAARSVAAGVIRVREDDRFQPTSAVDGVEAMETVDRLAELVREFQ